jgi:hypothetical protein
MRVILGVRLNGAVGIVELGREYSTGGYPVISSFVDWPCADNTGPRFDDHSKTHAHHMPKLIARTKRQRVVAKHND